MEKQQQREALTLNINLDDDGQAALHSLIDETINTNENTLGQDSTVDVKIHRSRDKSRHGSDVFHLTVNLSTKSRKDQNAKVNSFQPGLRLPSVTSNPELPSTSSRSKGTRGKDLYQSVKSRYMHFMSYKKPMAQSVDKSSGLVH